MLPTTRAMSESTIAVACELRCSARTIPAVFGVGRVVERCCVGLCMTDERCRSIEPAGSPPGPSLSMKLQLRYRGVCSALRNFGIAYYVRYDLPQLPGWRPPKSSLPGWIGLQSFAVGPAALAALLAGLGCLGCWLDQTQISAENKPAGWLAGLAGPDTPLEFGCSEVTAPLETEAARGWARGPSWWGALSVSHTPSVRCERCERYE